MVELRLLGPPQVLRSKQQAVETLTRQPKRMALLAYLAVALPRGLHRRDKLLALFWPELDQPHARNALSQALYVLRNALGENTVVTHGDDEVGIAADAVRSDVTAFEAALDSGHPEEAILLYRGDLLDGFFLSDAPEFEKWLDSEQTRLRERASRGAWVLAREKANAGEGPEAARYARWAANLMLPDEIQIRQLMTFLHDLGDRSAAIRAYAEFAAKLASEYELQPSAQTQALARAIREDKTRVSASADHSLRSQSDDSLEQPPIASLLAEPPSREPRSSLITQVAAGLLLVAVVGLATAFAVRTRGEKETPEAVRVPRLVVVPLANLGAPENAYFAEGIGDEIGMRLAGLRGLNVIGGAAARRYKIAQSTDGVGGKRAAGDYFLEGTASWVPSAQGRGRVRVTLQLLDGHNGTHRWGIVLEEDINSASELFSLYSSIAQRVVNELDIVLGTPGVTPAPTIPTTSLQAYNDYMRGRDYLRRPSTAVNFAAAIQALERAVQRDSSFALAYALLSNAHVQAVWLGGMSREHLVRAKAAGERALAIDPQSPDGHLFLGVYYYVCCEDYERARWYLAKSHAMRPGNGQVVMYMGNVHKRQGRWGESIKYFEEAARLDPLARWPVNNLGHAQLWSRRYDDAEKTFRRVLSFEPQDIFAHAHLAWLLVLRDGDTRSARAVVAQAARSSEGFAEMRIPFYLELLDRKYDAALAALTESTPGLTESLLNEWLVSDNVRRALVLRLKGDSAAAKTEFAAAETQLEAGLRGVSPDSRRAQLWLRSGRAIALAGLGRRAEAMEQIEFVMASNPLKVDAIEGPKYLQHVALAHVMLGNNAPAIDVLGRLVSVGAPVSRRSLGLEPFWDPLRNEPGFVSLVGGE